MKFLTKTLAIALAVFGMFSCCNQATEQHYTAAKLNVEVPVFNDYQTSITDHGAVNDGKTNNSSAIAKAIDACNATGGGTVIIPKGLWITGPIELKSNVNLHIEEGALVMFSKNLDDYPLIQSNFEGRDEVRAKPLLYAKDAENIAITGKGVFDGSGQIWRPVKRTKLTEPEWKDLVKGGGVVDEEAQMWYPNQGALEAAQNPDLAQSTSLEGKEKYKAFLRPPLVNLVNCNKVLFDGPTFQNSPGWCIHPFLSNNLTFVNINIRNPWNAQNGDGIDIESCRYVSFENNTLDVGDDAICLKSGRDEEGRKRGVPTEDVTIKNCVVYHGHGGFVVGSEMSGGVRNIDISDCSFIGTDVGLRFKSNRQRGGVVENITIDNIYMINILTNAIGFNLFYGGLSVVEQNELGIKPNYEPAEITESTPQFKNIKISNIICNGAQTAIYMNGLPEMPIENIELENIHINSTKGAALSFVKSVKIKNVEIKSECENNFNFFNAENVTMTNHSDYSPEINISGKDSKNISIDCQKKETIVLADEVNPESISRK